MIESKLTEQTELKKLYPILKKFRTSHIVFFTAPKVGTIVWVSKTSPNKLGEYCTTWDEPVYETLKGTITLTNGED